LPPVGRVYVPGLRPSILCSGLGEDCCECMGELVAEGAKKREVMLGLEVVDLADGGEDCCELVAEGAKKREDMLDLEAVDLSDFVPLEGIGEVERVLLFLIA